MNDQGLLQEIEEDLSRKKMEARWKKHGATIIGAAVAIVLGTALSVGWKSYKVSEAQSTTAELVTVFQEAKDSAEEKITSLEAFAAKKSGKAHAVFAKLQAASLAMKENNKEKALALYNEIATDDKLEVFLRQLGDLLVVQTTLDDGEPLALESRLSPLMDKECVWRYSAYEYAGYLALRLEDKEKAKKLFTELKELPNVPTDFISRANDIIRWIDGGK